MNAEERAQELLNAVFDANCMGPEEAVEIAVPLIPTPEGGTL